MVLKRKRSHFFDEALLSVLIVGLNLEEEPPVFSRHCTMCSLCICVCVSALYCAPWTNKFAVSSGGCFGCILYCCSFMMALSRELWCIPLDVNRHDICIDAAAISSDFISEHNWVNSTVSHTCRHRVSQMMWYSLNSKFLPIQFFPLLWYGWLLAYLPITLSKRGFSYGGFHFLIMVLS